MSGPRYLEIAYGSIVASSTISNCTLDLIEVSRLRRSLGEFEVRFSVLLTTPTGLASDFATAAAAIEVGYSRPFQDVTVRWVDPDSVLSDANLIALSHSNATGLEILAEIEKPGGELLDTQLSRRYDVTIRGGLPPHSSYDGVRSQSYDLTTDANCRRRLVVRGEYTATNGSAASNQAAAKIATRSAALLALLGTTAAWKLVRSDILSVSTNDLTAEAEQEWEERIFNDSASTPNDSRLRRVSLKIRRSKEGATGSPSVRRLATMVGSYEAEVCHTETVDLLSLYEASVRPWIVANMRLAAPGGFFAIVSDEPELDRTDNRLTATIVALTSSGGNLIELERSEVLDIAHGAIEAPVWDPSTSIESEEPSAHYVWAGPKQVTFTETLRQVTIGSAKSIRPGGFVGGLGVQPAANNPFAALFGVGAISKPGESFLSFLGPDAAGPAQAGGLWRGAGGGGAGGGAGGAGASGGGSAGVVYGFKVTTQHTSKPGVRGIYPDQFEIEERTTTRATRYVKGAGSGGGGAQPSPSSTRTRR